MYDETDTTAHGPVKELQIWSILDLEDIHRRGVVTSLLAIPIIYLYVHVCFMQEEGTSYTHLPKPCVQQGGVAFRPTSNISAPILGSHATLLLGLQYLNLNNHPLKELRLYTCTCKYSL